MLGWDVNGHPMTLTAGQCAAVLGLLDWDWGADITLAALPEPGDRSVVLATAARYDRARAAGAPFKDDPRQ